MASFDRIKPGDVLYDYHSQKMGNTTISTMGNWPVRVIEVDREKRVALVSWNSNPPTLYSERRIARLRRTPGKERDPFGRSA